MSLKNKFNFLTLFAVLMWQLGAQAELNLIQYSYASDDQSLSVASLNQVGLFAKPVKSNDQTVLEIKGLVVELITDVNKNFLLFNKEIAALIKEHDQSEKIQDPDFEFARIQGQTQFFGLLSAEYRQYENGNAYLQLTGNSTLQSLKGLLELQSSIAPRVPQSYSCVIQAVGIIKCKILVRTNANGPLDIKVVGDKLGAPNQHMTISGHRGRVYFVSAAHKKIFDLLNVGNFVDSNKSSYYLSEHTSDGDAIPDYMETRMAVFPKAYLEHFIVSRHGINRFVARIQGQVVEKIQKRMEEKGVAAKVTAQSKILESTAMTFQKSFAQTRLTCVQSTLSNSYCQLLAE